VDFRSDLWSLGVVVYHALTGVRPFDAETLGALCVKLHSAEFEQATRVRSGLPPNLDAWFARALARQPQDRFGSAKELSDAFAAIADAFPSAQLARTARAETNGHVAPALSAPSLQGSRAAADTMGQATAVLQQSFIKRPSGWLWLGIGLAVLVVVAALSLWVRGATPATASSAPEPVVVTAAAIAPSAPPASMAEVASASPAPSTTAPIVAAAANVAAQPGALVPSAQPAIAVVRAARAPQTVTPTQGRHAELKPTPPATTAVVPHPASGTAHAEPATPAPIGERPTKKDRGF
jgi:serine/threonine-protein kinase